MSRPSHKDTMIQEQEKEHFSRILRELDIPQPEVVTDKNRGIRKTLWQVSHNPMLCKIVHEIKAPVSSLCDAMNEQRGQADYYSLQSIKSKYTYIRDYFTADGEKNEAYIRYVEAEYKKKKKLGKPTNDRFVFEVHFADTHADDSYRGTIIIEHIHRDGLHKEDKTLQERESDRQFWEKITESAIQRAYHVVKTLKFHPWDMMLQSDNGLTTLRHFEAREPLTREKLLEIRRQALLEEQEAEKARQERKVLRDEKHQHFLNSLTKAERKQYDEAVAARKSLPKLKAALLRYKDMKKAGKTKRLATPEKVAEWMNDYDRCTAMVDAARERGWKV